VLAPFRGVETRGADHKRLSRRRRSGTCGSVNTHTAGLKSLPVAVVRLTLEPYNQ
jgi:hypothetical protein